MSRPPTDTLLHLLQTAPGSATPDRDLLRRFAARRDEAAFAELVRRHGAMVRRAARRVLGDGDADDVFQAAFLVLAKKAGAAGWQPSVGPWLYQVACRLALRVRRDNARRRARERSVPTAAAAGDPLADISVREAQAIFDEELLRLSAALRAPLVLCFLEGATRDKAAARLGWSLGTVARRLRQGRAVLQARLARRGLGLSAALLATVLALPAEAAPTALARDFVRAAALFARGDRTAGVVSTRVAALVRAAGREALLRKLCAAAVLLAVAAVVAVGAVVAAAPLLTEDPEPAAPVAAAAPLPQGQPPQGAADVKVTAGPVFDCRNVAKPDDPSFGPTIHVVAVSPDGKAVVTVTSLGNRVFDAETGKPLTPAVRTGFVPQTAAYRADGKAMLLAGYGLLQVVDAGTCQPLFDLAKPGVLQGLVRGTQDKQAAGGLAAAFNPDGTLLVVADRHSDRVNAYGAADGKLQSALETKNATVRQVVFHPKGRVVACAMLCDNARGAVRLWDTTPQGPPGPLLDLDNEVYLVAFSPDGKQVLTVNGRVQIDRGGDRCKGAMRLWDVATGKEIGKAWDNDEALRQVTFSPDGTRVLAVTEDKAVLFDAATGKRVHEFNHGRPRSLAGAGWLNGGKWVVTGGDTPGGKSDWRGSVRVWDVAPGKLLADAANHPQNVTCLAITPDGLGVVTGSSDGRARLWRVGEK
jgi:RNA polymerase sigma factor (sigma-70 family)